MKYSFFIPKRGKHELDAQDIKLKPSRPDCQRCKDTGSYYVWNGRDEGGNVYCDCAIGRQRLAERESA